jgi:hypothetical protein
LIPSVIANEYLLFSLALTLALGFVGVIDGGAFNNELLLGTTGGVGELRSNFILYCFPLDTTVSDGF